jgi:hypothetical protein
MRYSGIGRVPQGGVVRVMIISSYMQSQRWALELHDQPGRTTEGITTTGFSESGTDGTGLTIKR